MKITSGLADILRLDDGDASERLVFAALATPVAASSLATIAYRANGIPALGRLAAAVAAPVVAGVYQASSFVAAADDAPADAPAGDPVGADAKASFPELKSVLSLYTPKNLCWVFGRNVFLQVLMKVNMHLGERLEHEKQALSAEARGELPPEEPEFPELKPAVGRGLSMAMREVAVATTRRLYEHAAVKHMKERQARALLRDARSWARDVLAVKHASDPAGRRLYAYYFATLHSQALFYAADCTVSIVQHTYRAWKRRKTQPLKKVLLYWGYGVALQFARCTLTLLVASGGSALGSLIKPGAGTYYGMLPVEIVMSIACNSLINTWLE